MLRNNEGGAKLEVKGFLRKVIDRSCLERTELPASTLQGLEKLRRERRFQADPASHQAGTNYKANWNRLEKGSPPPHPTTSNFAFVVDLQMAEQAGTSICAPSA